MVCSCHTNEVLSPAGRMVQWITDLVKSWRILAGVQENLGYGNRAVLGTARANTHILVRIYDPPPFAPPHLHHSSPIPYHVATLPPETFVP